MSDLNGAAADGNFCPLNLSTLPDDTFLLSQVVSVTNTDDPAVDYSSHINQAITFDSSGSPNVLFLDTDDPVSPFWSTGAHQVVYKRGYASSLTSPEWTNLSESTQEF